MATGSRPTEGPRLTTDRIVASALELAHRDGLAGASMRRVAGALGVEVMSLYYYVPSKAALMVLMADRSVSQMSEPDPAQSWGQRLIELLVQTFLVALDNPTVFPVLVAAAFHPGTLPPATDDDAGAPSVGLLEKVLVLLEEGQVPSAHRVHAFRGLISVVVGFVAAEVDGLLPHAKERSTSPDPRQQIDAPLLSRMHAAMVTASPTRDLRFTLEILLQGLRTVPPIPETG